MNRKIKRILTGMVWIAIMTFGMSFTALAARIAFSDPSAKTGESFSVRMRITASEGGSIGNAVVTLSYDPTLIEFVEGEGVSGGAGTVRASAATDSQNASELVFDMTFRALRAGNASITVASEEVYDSDSQTVTIDQTGSSAITVSAAESDSKNAKLAGLQISPGTLSPAFSADIHEYTATVGADTDSLTVDAPAVDSGARVSVSGNDDLQMGENEIICTVTAQDGQTVQTYTIIVTKTEGTEGEETPSEEGVILKTPERSVTVYPIEEGVTAPDGFVPCQVSIDGHDVQGWVWSAADPTNPQYCIFYATNENGESDFYRYDLVEKTVQRYFRDPLVDAASDSEYAALVDNYNSLLDDYNLRYYIIIGLIVLAVVLLIVIIALVATRGSKDDFYEKRQDNRDYPQRHKSERQKKASSQNDRRRISREERYMRGMEEEEEAAEQEDPYRTENRVREQQSQRRQAQQSGQGTDPRQRPAGTYGQRPAAPGAQRQTGAGGTGQYPQGSMSAQPDRSVRQYPQGQRPVRPAPQTRQPGAAPGGSSDGEGFIVRGPAPQDENGAVRGGTSGPRGTSGNGGDDDFEVIDMDE